MTSGLQPSSQGLCRLLCRAVLWPLKKAALGGLRCAGPVSRAHPSSGQASLVSCLLGSLRARPQQGAELRAGEREPCPRGCACSPTALEAGPANPIHSPGHPALTLLTEGLMWPTRLDMLARGLGSSLIRDTGAPRRHPANKNRCISHQTRRVGRGLRSLPT